MTSLTKNLRKARRLSLVSRAQVMQFKIHMMSYKRLIKNFEVQFDALWSSTSKPSNNNEASTSQVSVETGDEAIACHTLKLANLGKF
jgi:hypothetical protein